MKYEAMLMLLAALNIFSLILVWNIENDDASRVSTHAVVFGVSMHQVVFASVSLTMTWWDEAGRQHSVIQSSCITISDSLAI